MTKKIAEISNKYNEMAYRILDQATDTEELGLIFQYCSNVLNTIKSQRQIELKMRRQDAYKR